MDEFKIVRVVTHGTYLKGKKQVLTPFEYRTKSLTPKHASLRADAAAAGQYAETAAYGPTFNQHVIPMCERKMLGTVGDPALYRTAMRMWRDARAAKKQSASF